MHCVLPTVTLPTTDLQNYRLFFSSLSKFSNNYKVHYKAQNLRLTPVAYSMKQIYLTELIAISILVEFGTVSSLKKGNLRSNGFVRARAQTRLLSEWQSGEERVNEHPNLLAASLVSPALTYSLFAQPDKTTSFAGYTFNEENIGQTLAGTWPCTSEH